MLVAQKALKFFVLFFWFKEVKHISVQAKEHD